MSWEIVVGIITLLTTVIAIGKIVFSLAKVITKLDDSVNNLSITLSRFQDDNTKEHTEFRNHISEHEIRIHDLEVKR